MYSTSRAIRGSPGRACVCARVPGRRIPSNTENTPNRGNVPADSMPCRRGTFNGPNVESRNHQTVNIGDTFGTQSDWSREVNRESEKKSNKKAHPIHERASRSKNAKVWEEDTSTSSLQLKPRGRAVPTRAAKRRAALETLIDAIVS